MLLLAGIFSLSTRESRPAEAANGGGTITHPGVVPDSAETGYPILLDTPTFKRVFGLGIGESTIRRQTFAVDMIGDYIVNGGDFLNVELQDGTQHTQERLAVFLSLIHI